MLSSLTQKQVLPADSCSLHLQHPLFLVCQHSALTETLSWVSKLQTSLSFQAPTITWTNVLKQSLSTYMDPIASVSLGNSDYKRPWSMTSFNLNYVFNGPISKYSHILRYWQLGLQCVTWERGKYNAAHNRQYSKWGQTRILSCPVHGWKWSRSVVSDSFRPHGL